MPVRRMPWLTHLVTPAVCAAALVGALAIAAPPASAAPAATGGGWGTAIEVPGTAALNTGQSAGMSSMSCPSSGNCTAGGWYTGSSGKQAFVVGATGGVWGSAIEVPGTAALNAGGLAQVDSVSCASAGNCAAGGTYSDSPGRSQAFLANEVGGVWGSAIEVPGTAALNAGGQADADSVSCAPGAAGACSAGGHYADSSGSWQAFAVSETGGVWGTATEVPGTAALNAGGLASADEVSCPVPGNCTVGGLYTDGSRDQQPFVARQTNGVWGHAIELPGITALNSGEFSNVNALSCTSAGNCAAAGIYTVGSGTVRQLFVASETNGSWAPAAEMPGLAALNAGQWSGVGSLSCTSAGNCAAGGFYEASTGRAWPFVINETKGVWGQAVQVPGISLLNKEDSAVNSVSCRSAGNCAAGGYYASYDGQYHEHLQAFVANEISGVWGQAWTVPGTAALNTGKDAMVTTVSCPRAGTCALGGNYALTVTPATTQVFVDTRG